MFLYDKAVPVNEQVIVDTTASATPFEGASSKASPPTTIDDTAHTNDRAGKHYHIWLVNGPAGCGKTTVAEYLADALDMPYIEGDAHHTGENLDKMRSGTPLTDADRWDWLTALRDESMRQIDRGSDGVIMTCSALKRKYRDVIRVAAYYDHEILVHFIFLNAPVEALLQRVTKRQGHYMGSNMVHSQFKIIERPAEDETDVISIDADRSIEEVKKDAWARVCDITKAYQQDQN
ncbi:shikimate kinase domain-containing protein [Hirsutella rhossiliensis]|uniref:Gluconokinase n=1 Tax=Hirsutella rhossiliensis TaxID=111463 RepID=A0A9P8N940_9HYPO|nr:shikimate kinase domain-containing protein [Hirsutella rhossiliensis]KAH0968782.1 shikimate kinase domain-containing protein [Hirsutella rhossiliensis]